MPRLSRVAVLAVVLLSSSLSCEDDPVAPAGPDTTVPALRLVEAIDSYHLRITFTEPVDPAWASGPGNYIITVPGSDERLGILSVRTSARRVDLSTSPMQAVRYDLTVRHLADLQGNTVDDVTTSFNGSNADDRTAPEIAEQSPAPGDRNVPLDQPIDVFFSEGVLLYYSDITVTTNGEVVPRGIIGINGYDHYQIHVPFRVSRSYTVTMSGIVDLAGNQMNPREWSFTTTSVPDTQPPTLSVSSPFNGQTDVRVDTWIDIYFSEMIDVGSFTPTFSPPVEGTANWWPDGRQVSFRPESVLAADTEYTITIPAGGFNDVAGNSNVEPYTITFRTAPAAARLAAGSASARGRTDRVVPGLSP